MMEFWWTYQKYKVKITHFWIGTKSKLNFIVPKLNWFCCGKQIELINYLIWVVNRTQSQIKIIIYTHLAS